MNFYEELGVPPDAPPETIRDAYRTVARLLHPDVQTDPALKQSAEAQMRRINHLYSILSDPERRRLYDEELTKPLERTPAIFIQAPMPADWFERLRGSNQRGNLVWFAATALCATFIFWLATRESPSGPVAYPQSSSTAQAPGAQLPPSPRTRPAIRPSPPSPQPSTPSHPEDTDLAVLRGQLLAANTAVERLQKELAARETEHKVDGPANLTPAPLVAAPPPPEIPLSAALPPAAAPPPSTARWAGSWAYRQSLTRNRNHGLVPPEFIEAFITEDQRGIHGQYHARFLVAGAGISPDVDFHFDGKLSGLTGRLPWTGSGGARGEVQLHLVSDSTLEIGWSATNLGATMALASGTAVLTRRN